MTRVFIAGTMQGARAGLGIRDQSYRAEIAAVLARTAPHAQAFDPSEEVQRILTSEELRSLVVATQDDHAEPLFLDALPAPIQEVRSAFLRMTAEAGHCDLCIAYLPEGTPSMGTAMEMYAASLAGVPIVAVTDMVTNLAIASVATWIVPDLHQLEALLRDTQVLGGVAVRG